MVISLFVSNQSISFGAWAKNKNIFFLNNRFGAADRCLVTARRARVPCGEMFENAVEIDDFFRLEFCFCQ